MATTLATLRTLIRERSDMESTQFVTDSMLTSWINLDQEELYDRVVAAFQDHFWTPVDFTLTGGSVANSQYSLPAGLRFMRWLESSPDTRRRAPVKRWTLGEKDGVSVPRYRMLGGVIQIEPYENSAGTYRLYYVANPTALSGDSDAIDAKIDTWREYIVVKGAIRARTREESDTTDLQEDLARQVARIDAMAAMRDTAHPARINDVSQEGWPTTVVGNGGGGGFF